MFELCRYSVMNLSPVNHGLWIGGDCFILRYFLRDIKSSLVICNNIFFLSSFPAAVAADVLVSLTHKLPRHYTTDSRDVLQSSQENLTASVCDVYTKLEELYLNSTFDLPVKSDQSHPQPVGATGKKTGCSVVANVMSKLMQRLMNIGNQLLETVTKDVSEFP